MTAESYPGWVYDFEIQELKRVIAEKEAELGTLDAEIIVLKGQGYEKDSLIASLQAEVKELVVALRKATVRHEILLGRFRGCDDDNGHKKHGVSCVEVPDWIEEEKALIDKHSERGKS